MKHTLAQLRSGELKGIKRLSLSENLTSFPNEIFDLADTLEILDLSNNLLSSLPAEISKLKKLKIAFFSNNRFTSVPKVFKECLNPYMLGFKNNQIEVFDEDILPLSISWLILTDNKLSKLPDSIGKLDKLQKFPLAGNQIRYLPDSMVNCKNLELIRLSANQLESIPSWLLELPKLSWLAFSSNPCSYTKEVDLKEIDVEDIELAQLLGEGASGEIYKGYSKELKQDVAIKFFKGDMTSDGYAADEMNAFASAGEHQHLIKVHGKLNYTSKSGLLLEYIPESFKNLGNPPDFQTCTRDTFEDGIKFNIDNIYNIATAIASVAAHLHSNGLMHGDLYAHNILIDDNNGCYLGDFGAATFYDINDKKYEKIEVRAFACLLDDMLSLSSVKDGDLYQALDSLKTACMNDNVYNRPFFKEIDTILKELKI